MLGFRPQGLEFRGFGFYGVDFFQDFGLPYSPKG